MKNSKQKIYGLTGGIACGKTTIANIFESLGASIIDFDILARKVVEPGREVLKKICEYFGEDILNQDGTLNRKKLSNKVFQYPEKRKKLESFTHPPIFEEYSRQVNMIFQKQPESIAIAVVPLLFEKEMQELFEKIILVYIPTKMQIKRLVNRDKINFDQAQKIIESQIPIDEKIKLSDILIKNEGSIEQSKKQVEHIWNCQLNNF